MKHTIFFADKYITFSNQKEGSYDLIVDSRADTTAEISRAKVIHFFEKYNSILFLCHTPNEAYELFCGEFSHRHAAGGVVSNHLGQTLMIKRNGRWDIPKGHLEMGESLEECAVREVEEETGVSGIKLGAKIISTQHAYRLNDEWIIKTSHWYSMQSQSLQTAPQHEEGIEIAQWCNKEEVADNLEKSYPTIRLVFEAIKAQ